jgi:hypothetical protein
MKHTNEVSKAKVKPETTPKQAQCGDCKQFLKEGNLQTYVDCLFKGVPSDRRLKRNVRGLRGALSKLLRLRGVSFEYNELGQERGCPTGERPGFVAQDVEEVMPQWVQYDADGYRRLAIEGFEGLAVEALRELKAENDQLRANLADLRTQVQELAEERQAAAF